VKTRRRPVRANAAVATPSLADSIMLPAGYSFANAEDYVKVFATQQIRDGVPVVCIHVSVIAHPRLQTPVVVSVEDNPHVDKTQVRPRRPAPIEHGIIVAT
jgi:hypothetical protein